MRGFLTRFPHRTATWLFTCPSVWDRRSGTYVMHGCMVARCNPAYFLGISLFAVHGPLLYMSVRIQACCKATLDCNTLHMLLSTLGCNSFNHAIEPRKTGQSASSVKNLLDTPTIAGPNSKPGRPPVPQDLAEFFKSNLHGS